MVEKVIATTTVRNWNELKDILRKYQVPSGTALLPFLRATYRRFNTMVEDTNLIFPGYYVKIIQKDERRRAEIKEIIYDPKSRMVE